MELNELGSCLYQVVESVWRYVHLFR